MDDNAAAIEIVRMLGTEFKDMQDEVVSKWLDLQKTAISKKKFGKDYDLALALLACHAMKMAGNGDTSLGTIANTGRIASISEGGESISFASTTASASADAEYQLTAYGLQFISVRNRHIMPIMIR